MHPHTQSLRYILSKSTSGQPESDISDTDDEDGRAEGTEDKWLMVRLPSLPHFSSVLPKVSHLLLQACLVETNLRHLLSYILFITRHIPRDHIFEFSIGISQIVVDRFSIIKKVFKSRGAHAGGGGEGGGVGADAMLGSLLNMLRVSLETAIQSQRMPQVSGSSDFVVVGFLSSKKTILHTALIHATLLLLTCSPSPPLPPACNDFEFLMNLWFPATGDQFPEAYLVEDKEPTPIISRTILPEMLYSRNARVLGLCLRDAGIADLCASVRQFGIPATSMQQILAHLDTLCLAKHEDTLSELKRAIDNPAQLAQFAEVQLMRCGCNDGTTFLSFVRKLGNLPDDPVQSVSEMLAASSETQEVEMMPVSPSTQEKPNILRQMSAEKIEQVLMKGFAPTVGRSSLTAEEVTKQSSDIVKGLKELIHSAAATPSGSRERAALNTSAGPLFAALHKVVVQCTGRTRRQVLEGMAKSTFAISLLRLLTRIWQLQQDDCDAITEEELFKPTVKQISDSLASLKFGTKLKQLPRFQAVVKACAKSLGLKTLPERESQLEKIIKVTEGCVSGIRREKDLFSSDQAMMIGDIVRLVGTEKQSPHVEKVLSALVCRSITCCAEVRCMELLHSLEWRCRPIALYHCPDVFRGAHWTGNLEETAKAATHGTIGNVSTSHPPFVHSLDMSGLKVDLLELLDPEIVRVTPELSHKEVFGRSVQNGGVRLGPGYLMARLVHESSWDTLLQTVTCLLEKECLDEG